jgi:hypothetical protein
VVNDYGEQLAVDAESEFIERQSLPECSNCGRVNDWISGEDDRFPGLCNPCLEERMEQAAHDDYIDHLIDMDRER